MKKYFFIASLLLLINCFLSISYAQITPIDPQEDPDNDIEMSNDKESNDDKSSNSFWSRVKLGGNLGASFGTFTSVDISPIIGYEVTKKFTAGVGFTYQYISVNDPTGYYVNYKETILGGRLFAEYDLIYGIFAHAEYEHLFVNINLEDPYDDYKQQFPGLPLGFGYKSGEGNAYMYLLAMYNVLYNSDPLSPNPYGSPWIFRIGFNIGL